MRQVGVLDALEERFYRLLADLRAEDPEGDGHRIEVVPGADIFPAGDQEQVFHRNNAALQQFGMHARAQFVGNE